MKKQLMSSYADNLADKQNALDNANKEVQNLQITVEQMEKLLGKDSPGMQTMNEALNQAMTRQNSAQNDFNSIRQPVEVPLPQDASSELQDLSKVENKKQNDL